MEAVARPTLSSVAVAARVSRQTVSNVINSPEVVAVATLERVRAVIDELGYRPNAAARQMRTRRSRLIAFRIEPTRDGVNGVVADRFLHALTESAQESGYRVMLFTAADDDAEIRAYDDLMASLDLDGTVVSSTHAGDRRTSWLTDHGLPFVTFGRPWGTAGPGVDPRAADGPAAGAHPWVDVDGAVGTAAVTEHLVSLGHRRIAFLGWPAGSGVGDDRRAGWLRASMAAGLSVDGMSHSAVDDTTAGRATTAALLDTCHPTALVCASDTLAVGALLEAGTRGLRVGRDLSVTGFDDTPAARALDLTSVSQPLVEAARRCVRTLADSLAGAPARSADARVLPAPAVLLDPTVTWRPSVGPPVTSDQAGRPVQGRDDAATTRRSST